MRLFYILIYIYIYIYQSANTILWIEIPLLRPTLMSTWTNLFLSYKEAPRNGAICTGTCSIVWSGGATWCSANCTQRTRVSLKIWPSRCSRTAPMRSSLLHIPETSANRHSRSLMYPPTRGFWGTGTISVWHRWIKMPFKPTVVFI